MAPPVNGTTLVPPGALLPVAVEGGTIVALVTGEGNGALLDDDDGVDAGVRRAAAAGVEEGFGLVDGDGATGGEEGARGADVLGDTERERATVWPGLKVEGRVRPNWRAQVAGSSPWVALGGLVGIIGRKERIGWKVGVG